MEKYHKTDISPIEKENERDEAYEAQNPEIDCGRTSNNYHTVRIVYGKPIGGAMDDFFSSVLSMFTPVVTSRSSRLEEIKEELEDEKERQDKLKGYYHSK